MVSYGCGFTCNDLVLLLIVQCLWKGWVWLFVNSVGFVFLLFILVCLCC